MTSCGQLQQLAIGLDFRYVEVEGPIRHRLRLLIRPDIALWPGNVDDAI